MKMNVDCVCDDETGWGWLGSPFNTDLHSYKKYIPTIHSASYHPDVVRAPQ